MKVYNPFLEALNTISYSPLKARLLGSVEEAVFVQEIENVSQAQQIEGWARRTPRQIEIATGLLPAAQKRVRKSLKRKGILQEIPSSDDDSMYFRINKEKFNEFFRSIEIEEEKHEDSRAR